MKNEHENDKFMQGFITALIIIAVILLAGLAARADTIDTESYWLDMAIDDAGKQHLSYAKGNSIYYRFKPSNGAWSNAFLVPGSENTYYSRFSPHITVDKQGGAHIVWTNYDHTRIYYNHYNQSSGWTGLQIAIQDFVYHAQWPKQDTVRPGIACTANNEILVVAQNDSKITCNWIYPGGQFNRLNYITIDVDSSEPKSPAIGGNLKSNKAFGFWTRSAKIKGSIFHGINNGGFGPMFYISGGGGCCPNNSDVFIDEFENIYIAYWETVSHTTDISSLNYVARINNQWSPIEALTPGNISIYCPDTECVYPRVLKNEAGTVIVIYSDGKETDTNPGAIYCYYRKADSTQWKRKLIDSGNFPAACVEGNIFHIAYKQGNIIKTTILDFNNGGLVTPTPSRTLIPANTNTPTLTVTETPSFTPEPTETEIEPTATYTATMLIEPTPEPTIRPPIPPGPRDICGFLGGFFILIVSIIIPVGIVKRWM